MAALAKTLANSYVNPTTKEQLGMRERRLEK